MSDPAPGSLKSWHPSTLARKRPAYEAVAHLVAAVGGEVRSGKPDDGHGGGDRRNPGFSDSGVDLLLVVRCEAKTTATERLMNPCQAEVELAAALLDGVSVMSTSSSST